MSENENQRNRRAAELLERAWGLVGRSSLRGQSPVYDEFTHFQHESARRIEEYRIQEEIARHTQQVWEQQTVFGEAQVQISTQQMGDYQSIPAGVREVTFSGPMEFEQVPLHPSQQASMDHAVDAMRYSFGGGLRRPSPPGRQGDPALSEWINNVFDGCRLRITATAQPDTLSIAPQTLPWQNAGVAARWTLEAPAEATIEAIRVEGYRYRLDHRQPPEGQILYAIRELIASVRSNAAQGRRITPDIVLHPRLYEALGQALREERYQVMQVGDVEIGAEAAAPDGVAYFIGGPSVALTQYIRRDGSPVVRMRDVQEFAVQHTRRGQRPRVLVSYRTFDQLAEELGEQATFRGDYPRARIKEGDPVKRTAEGQAFEVALDVALAAFAEAVA